VTDGETVPAREAIRDLIARYNLYGDSGRIDEMLELFLDDAVMAVDRTTYQGRRGIRELMETSVGPAPQRVRHFTSTHVIDVAGDTATARCYFQVLTEQGLDHWGRYRDELRRVDGHWRFVRRDVRVDGMIADGWAAQATARRHEAP
jgi:ketosteroid isomerase-like protein